MSQVFVITGASTGFGALAARALATTGAHHVIFAGMYSHSGSTKEYEDDIATFNRSHNADIRPVALDLLDQDSCNAAIRHVLDSTGGRLDGEQAGGGDRMPSQEHVLTRLRFDLSCYSQCWPYELRAC